MHGPSGGGETSKSLRHHVEDGSERKSQAQVTQEQWPQSSSRPWWDAGFQVGSALEEGREVGTQACTEFYPGFTLRASET